jgi:DNA-binding transcriptional ArsR family regulator
VPRRAGAGGRDRAEAVAFPFTGLRLLRAARLVRSDRRGKQVFYEAEDHHIRCVVADMMEHAAEEAGIDTGKSAA